MFLEVSVLELDSVVGWSSSKHGEAEGEAEEEEEAHLQQSCDHSCDDGKSGKGESEARPCSNGEWNM